VAAKRQAAGQGTGGEVDASRANWERLRGMLRRIEQGGLNRLNPTELWELPGVYRRALSDLSLLRTQKSDPQLAHELGQLCNRAHAVIYRSTLIRRRRAGLLNLVGTAIPLAVRRNAGYVWVAVGTLILFGLVAFLNSMFNPGVAGEVLSMAAPEMLEEWEAGLRGAREMEDLRLAAQIAEEERSFAAVQITFNNIRVAVIAFISGILGGVPAVLILAFNGYLLGAVAYLYAFGSTELPVDLGLYFFAGVAPHGLIELAAICIAGGAGLRLGLSWVLPGRRTRRRALVLAARDALGLVGASALTLVVAGIVEGFVTPLNPPVALDLEVWYYMKIGFGVLLFGLWLLWLAAPASADSAVR
jgi:uncharacterized membrane protein SpoIIM required for sporulation